MSAWADAVSIGFSNALLRNSLSTFMTYMTLLEQLTNDYKEAMREKNEIKKIVLNLILAKIKNKKIELQKDLEDVDIVGIIKKEVKEILETMGFLEKANKLEDLEIEKQKKSFLDAYLPATMTKDQTTELLTKLISDHNITDLKTQR
ncbi:MAG: GatB/YqeY domain-containing protein [bacterium]